MTISSSEGSFMRNSIFRVSISWISVPTRNSSVSFWSEGILSFRIRVASLMNRCLMAKKASGSVSSFMLMFVKGNEKPFRISFSKNAVAGLSCGMDSS